MTRTTPRLVLPWPSGAFGFDAFGADASLMVDQQTDRMVGVVLGAFEEERLEYKGRKSAQWSRLQAADSLPTAADALLSLADAAGNEVAYGQMHATGGYIYGTSTLIRDVMKGRWIQLGSNFAEGVGEHLGEVILGAETVGVGVETESPGLVMDGGVQVASGTVKLAGDAMMVRGALGGLKGIAAKGGADDALLPNLSNAEIDAAFANRNLGSMVEAPAAGISGSGPKLGGPKSNIWFHDNLRVQGASPTGGAVNIRTHSANPGAPAGSFSSGNYTTQIHTNSGRYLLPDGSWKKIHQMTPVERAAAHIPAGN